MASLLCTFSNDWIITVNHMRAYLGICDLVVEVFHQKWSKFLKDFLWKAEPSWWRNTEVQSSMLSARDERAPLQTALSGFCLQRPLNWQWQWTPSFWPRTGNRSLSCKDQCFLSNCQMYASPRLANKYKTSPREHDFTDTRWKGNTRRWASFAPWGYRW